MRKLTSLPSTRAEEVLYTDFTQIPSATTPSHTLTNIFAFFRDILKIRIQIYQRDIHEMYEIDPKFFILYFDAYSPEELWDKLQPGRD